MSLDLERAEMSALRDMMDAVSPEEAAAHGFELADVGGGMCCRLRAVPGMRELNRVMGLGLDRPATDADLDAIAELYGGEEHVIALAPFARCVDLAPRGYTPGYAWMKFSRPADPDARSETELRLARVGAERAQDFVSVVLTAYEMPDLLSALVTPLPGRPGWSCWVAYDDGMPVGAGAAFFVDGHSAWLGFAGTLPEARGRGAQSAILAARVREAAQRGCAVVTTETGVREPDRPDRSYRNILRSGFQEAYERPNWRSP